MHRSIFATVIVAIACLIVTSGLQAQNETCAEAGTLSRETYLSAISSHERKFTIYLPPCYQATEESYPLLLLLHGSDADDSQWTRLGFLNVLETAIQQKSAPPMIVLMPYGGSIANKNHFNGISYDRILLDLLNQAEERYRANGARAIGGISRGGFWAFHLGLRFADEFVAIGGHSPYFDREHAEPADNPLYLAQSLRPDTHLQLWMDRGTNDHAADGIDRMHVILRNGDVSHQYVVQPGGDHSERSWRRYIEDYLDFYTRALDGSDAPEAALEQATEDGLELWLPAAGFGALRTSMESADLTDLLAGGLDERLILSESNADRLRRRGIVLHPLTQIVPDTRLFPALWRDKQSYTLLPFEQLHLRLRPLWLDDVPVVDQLARYPLVFQERGAQLSEATA